MEKTTRSRSDEPVMHERFDTCAAATPAAEAVVSITGEALTYAALRDRADRFARHLQQRGIGPDAVVGLLLDRSPDLIVALLGILKAGGACLPIDPMRPHAWITATLDETRAALIVTRERLRSALPPSTLPVVCVDREWEPGAGQVMPETTDGDAVPYGNGAAWLVQASGASNLDDATSGTRPVPITHRALLSLVSAMLDAPVHAQRDPHADSPANAHAGAVADGVGHLAAGAVAAIPTHEAPAPPSVEATTKPSFAADDVWLQLAPLWTRAACVEIGGALLHGARLVLFPPEEPALDTLARVLTTRGVTSVCLTGDLFQLLVDERLSDLGGLRQILIVDNTSSVAHLRRALDALRACRILVGEEPAVHGGVAILADCACLRWTDGRALVDAAPGGDAVDSHGSIETVRASDGAGAGRAEAAREPALPESPLEQLVWDVWRSVLGRQPSGIDVDFFDLGGNSLLAMRVLARVGQALGDDVPLRVLFDHPTVRGMARALDAVGEPARAPALTPVTPVDRGGELPLTFSQERVWFLEQLHAGNNAYQAQLTLRLRGPLNRRILERCLTEIVRRHESLRSSVETVEGRPRLVIHPPRPVRVPVIDLRTGPAAQREAEAERLVNEEIRRPFDSSRLPLVRWTLLKLGARDHIFVQAEHHLVHDGWASNIFLGELFSFYAALAAKRPLPALDPPTQLADFAAWQRGWFEGEVARRQLAFWTRTLADAPRLLDLPADHARPPVQSFRGGAPRIPLPIDLAQAVRAFSRAEGMTLFMTMLTAFVALLYRYTRQADLCVGTHVANRRSPESESVVGMVINTIVLRTDVSGDPTIRELLQRVRAMTLDAYAHQDVPFDKVVEALHPDRNLAHSPLVQALFSFHDAACPRFEVPGLTAELTEAQSNGSSKFDLNLTGILYSDERAALSRDTVAGGISLIWEYNGDLFEPETIARMAAQYAEILRGCIEQPDQRVSTLPLLPAAEREQLQVTWNRTQAAFPEHETIHGLVEACAARTPDAIAVMTDDARWTYRELEARAEAIADALEQQGVGPEMRVGVCVERSASMVAAVLGVLKAGGAYVPIDPDHPAERIAFLLEDAHAAAVLTESPLLERCGLGAARAICLDRLPAASEPRASGARAGARPGARNLAYVIYTSGSTGKPKGVQVEHRSVVNLLTAMRRDLDVSAKDVLLAVTTLAFDIAGLELWLPLTTGATVAIASRATAVDPEQLPRALDATGATLMQATPATWRMLVESGWSGRPNLTLLCGGEALPRELAERLRPLGAALWNLYGPTETTIWSTTKRLIESEAVDLGRPLANTEIFVMDERGELTPIGVPGELLIGGAGLARGYLDRPDITADRFVPHPFIAGARLYRTGDLVRWTAAGTLAFLGRLDHQVKLRGFRLEPGEIETRLRAHPSVGDALVLLRDETGHDPRLVAYVVHAPGARIEAPALREHLKRSLPDYAVPAVFMPLDAWPLTPNGKIDRRGLPEPSADTPAASSTTNAVSSPRTPTEEGVASIWSQVLRVSQLDVDDNFFDLGGHSLIAMQALHRIRATFKVDLNLRSLFDAPTVALLAREIERVQVARGAARPVR